MQAGTILELGLVSRVFALAAMLNPVAEETGQGSGDEEASSQAVNPFPGFNAAEEDAVMTVKVNTKRLEHYLQSIRERLNSYEASTREQHEVVMKMSKADEAKIAKLAVKLDHCIIDVNTFKDFVLSRQMTNTDLNHLDSRRNAVEAPDQKYLVAQLQSEVSALSLMVRRIELNQAEGLDSFAQIKQLNSALKIVTKELDSLGKNSVILELRAHVDRVVLSINADMAAAGAQREADIREVRGSFEALEEERLLMLEQRLQVIEEKSILYDMVLNEQGGGAEGDDGGEEEGEEMVGDGAAQASTKLLLSGTATEEAELLRPSQMLLQGAFREEDEHSNPDYSGPSSPTATGAGAGPAGGDAYSASTTTDVAGAIVRLGSGIFQNMSSSSNKSRVNRSATDAVSTSSKRGGTFSFIAAGSSRMVSGSGRQSVFSQKLIQGGPSASSRDRESCVAPTPAKRGNRESALRRSSFFANLMGQYVSRENHEEALGEEHAFAQSGIFSLQKQLKVLATSRMCGVLARAARDIMKWKYRHCFAQLVANVRNWSAVRDRRNKSKALMFHVRLDSLMSRSIKRMGLEHWRRATWLFKERERLRLWLRTKLQHWINMKIPNVKLYLNRWKRFTVYSYYSSLFVEDEGESTAISDDFHRLLNSENFSVYEVKRIAHDDMKRRWAHRARQERLLLQQESAIREHVHKVTMAITGGTFPGFQGAVSAEDFAALQSKCASMEEGLCSMRLEMRKILNELQNSDAAVDAKVEAEGRKITGEFNIYRSQVAVRFNDCKEGLLSLQQDVRGQFETEQKRLVRLEDHLKIIERRLDGEQSKIAPLVAEQQRMQSLLDGMKSELRCTDTQLGALHGQIDRAIGASHNTVESNHRMERTLAENSEYYDVELKFMRTHVTETVANLAAMKAEKQAFMENVETRVQSMLNDLNNFVERLPTGQELFDVCVEYEHMWGRLHSDGLEGTAELQALPDKLHGKVSQLSLRIAHHIAAAADRLVLARWTAGATAKKASINPQDAPKFVPGGVTNRIEGGMRDTVLSGLHPESFAAGGESAASIESAYLTDNLQVKVSFNMPNAHLVEQVRDELFHNYLSAGFISLLRASDDAEGPPGLLKSTGRATFQRKLKQAVEAALTKYPVMLDPTQASHAAALSLARSSKKHQLARFTAQTGQAVSLAKRLNAEFDTCVSCGHELAAQLHPRPGAQQMQVLMQAHTAANTIEYAHSVANFPKMNENGRPGSALRVQPPNYLSTPTFASLAAPPHSPVQHPPPHGSLKRQDTPATPLDMFGSLDGSSSDEVHFSSRPTSPLSHISVTMIKKARPQSGRAPATNATFSFASVGNNAPDEGGKWSSVPKRPASASAALRHREAVKDAHKHQEPVRLMNMNDSSQVSCEHSGISRGQQSMPVIIKTQPSSTSSESPALNSANPNKVNTTPSIPAHVRGFGGSAGFVHTQGMGGSSGGGIATGDSPNMRSAGRESTIVMQVQSTSAIGSQNKSSPDTTSGRAGSGFSLPVQSAQQGSSLLAQQLAHRFQQDASFHGSAMRQVDPGNLLEPVQTSRKLFGTHQ